MFRRILIANRGEIALRILRACRTLGIEAIVAHSEADRDAPWLRRADGAICIGPAAVEGSYLNADAILQAAEQRECQAIHPGYGFLSENAAFSARCAQQGVAFIGPGAGAIRRMGDKLEAKRAMREAGLPVLPGSDGVLENAAAARRAADAAGYPVLLKARFGGGGRGLRRCENGSEIESAFAPASMEAKNAFGDGALYLEAYLEGARHIEFQILADAFGTAVHLGERECSIQRHHQKLVEESPSAAVTSAARDDLGERAARAAEGAGYRSAGTLEFLRDREGRLHFMEMNTRIQVEHPVTEMVTGVDLVVEQIRIAANQPLRIRQEDVTLSGHAIEARINAEDPDDGFRPDPGVVSGIVPPPSEAGGCAVRWDSALEEGYRIPPHYDSLIGKLIVHGADRAGALSGCRDALETLEIRGVRTTIPLLRRIVEDPDFVKGEYDVGFLARSGLVAVS